MRTIAGVVASLVFCLVVAASALAREGPFTWAHHAVGTTDAQAQQLFDEGLTCLYAYNRECAQDRFLAASARDPKLAIARWGYAMALGPNINYPSDTPMIVKAVSALTEAQSLAAGTSPLERALIDAASARFAVIGATGEVHELAYAQAMKRVAAAFADDPDVQALYAESYLNNSAKGISPDLLLLADPKAFVHSVERLAQRWPAHMGLAHYLIHLSEPEFVDRSIASANLLYSTPLAPQASHLNHMASHIYYYLGQWEKFAGASELAVGMDQQQAAARNVSPAKLDYWRHNLDFWYGGAVMSENEKSARAASAIVARDFAPMRWICAERFGHTDEAIALIDQAHVADEIAKSNNLRLLAMYALTNADAGRIAEARRVADVLAADPRQSPVRALTLNLLTARLADLAGDAASARSQYGAAAALQDTLIFEAAPPWYFAPRELLAAMELRLGNAQAAIIAAQSDLRRHQHNAHSMRILRDAYLAAGMKDDAARTDRALSALRGV